MASAVLQRKNRGAKALSSKVGNLSSAESAAPPNPVPAHLHHTLPYPTLRPKLCATQTRRPSLPPKRSAFTMRSLPQRQSAQHCLLLCDEGLDALAGVGHHLCELGFIKGLALGGGLDFHHFVSGGHYEIHVYVSPRVLFIAEVEQDFSIHNSHTNGGDEIFQRN